MGKRKAIKRYSAWADETRTLAYEQARALAVAFGGGEVRSYPVYDLGVVLGDGERVLHRCPAVYWWRSTDSWISQHTSYFGYSSTAREVTVPVLRPAGMLDWLVTDQRLVTRQQDGQVTSIYWSAINGVTVDLAAERVVLDGTAVGGGPFHGELHGPAVAPIGVAAIACCHGPHALLDHPALAPLRVGSAGCERSAAGRSDQEHAS